MVEAMRKTKRFYAYKLQEKLQESMEALEVMANLQAEQLQYMEDHALRKPPALRSALFSSRASQALVESSEMSSLPPASPPLEA